MPRWGAERRARPLHEVQDFMKSWASVLPQGGRRKDARRISSRCGSCTRLSALRLPSFRGGVFGDAFWLGFSFRFLGVSKTRVRRGIATTNVRMSQKDIRAFSKDIKLWRGDDPREAFRDGSRSNSGWRAHRACATIWFGVRSAICWDRSASAPRSRAAGSAHAAATTRGRAVGGFGASRSPSPRRCGTNGAGSSASSRYSAACGQAGAAAAIAPGRPIRHLGVV
jgi:hypothetical protein